LPHPMAVHLLLTSRFVTEGDRRLPFFGAAV
jgi:hypothetical protein